MEIRIHGLQIQHDQIRVLHQPFKARLIVGILPIGLPGSIQGGMHSFLMRQGKQFRDKGQLQHRFATADSDAAVFAILAPVLFVPQCLLKQGRSF